MQRFFYKHLGLAENGILSALVFSLAVGLGSFSGACAEQVHHGDESKAVESPSFGEYRANSAFSRKDLFMLHGAEGMWDTIENGLALLRLRGKQYAEFRPTSSISGEKGSISLWIKPLWGNDDGRSHTILSMPWNDGKSGYMALSWGWWEPSHARRLMFILNNQESLVCWTEIGLETKEWSMLTMIWNNGRQPGCRLFVDGQKLAQRDLAYQGNYVALGRIYLGSDAGSTEVRGRPSDFELANLQIRPNSLSESDAYRLYQDQAKYFPGLLEEKEKWLMAPQATAAKAPLTRQGVRIENRVMFDESAEWATSELSADRLLARLKKAGFNVLIPCVWHGRGAHYPSPVADMDPAIKAKVGNHRDPLAQLIQKAHRLGIEVHPWFTVVRREDDRHPEYYDTGTPAGAYDVHNERFRDYIVTVMLDVVKRYDVDGINLDYIRAMGVCQSDSCARDYARQTGRNLQIDLHGAKPGTFQYASIRAWQEAAVTDIVAKFSRRAKKIRPRLVVSVDGHPNVDTDKVGLDGRSEIPWAEQKLIDVIFSMDYRLKPDIDKITELMRKLEDTVTLVQIFGNYDKRDYRVFPRPGRIVAGYAKYAQNHWGRNGLAYYIASALSDEQISALDSGPFKNSAVTSWSMASKK